MAFNAMRICGGWELAGFESNSGFIELPKIFLLMLTAHVISGKDLKYLGEFK
jgi:hypothetical protein